MLYIFSRVYKMTAKEDFIDTAKQGKILVSKCTKCGNQSLSTVYYCQKCSGKNFESQVIDGTGSIATYTIITVPPTGFEKYTPYAWVVMSLDNTELRVSGFMPKIATPDELPVGTKAKVTGFDDRGIIIEKQ